LRKLLSVILAILVLSGTVVYPHHGFTSAQSDIDKQLAKVEQQAKDAQKLRDDALKTKKNIVSQKTTAVQSMQELQDNISSQGVLLNNLDKQLKDTTLNLSVAGAQLQTAEERVAARDALLKSRLRLMYMNGTVSYMDVLFSATSFSDFLDRFDSLTNIVGQDKSILKTNKSDRDIVDSKKNDIEKQLAQVKVMVAQTEIIKDKLSAQEGQKEVLIASLDKQAVAVEADDADAEKALINLAQQRSDLNKKKAELNAKKTFVYSGGKLGWPLPGRTAIGDGFAMRMDPIKHVMKLHKGIDIPAPLGTTIVAAESGTVLVAAWVSGYGNTVVLDHGGGLWTWYGHIRNGGIKVNEGDTVKRGDKIAEVGSTGDSTGNHLHFEVRVKREAVDPLPYLK